MRLCRSALLCVVLMVLFTHSTLAQHQGHQPPPAKPAAAKPAASPEASPSPAPEEESMHAGMEHGLVVVEDDEMFVRVGNSHANLMPMGRMGSGTS
ncbi:MAG TPA: hypothetical protein VFM63_11750, partial [Pyrinomonadaceae bacterium]|nr:hypothetical protein [Pyrinomonadaceae bacterium]